MQEHEQNDMKDRTKISLAIAVGTILSGLVITTVHAASNDGSGIRQTEGLRSDQSGTSVQPAPQKGGLSKRNKSMIEQSKAAKIRRDQIQSDGSGSRPKNASMSMREKAKKEVADQARKRQNLIRSENSNTGTKRQE